MVAVDLKGGRALGWHAEFFRRSRQSRARSTRFLITVQEKRLTIGGLASQRGRHTHTAVRTVLPSETTARNSEGIPVLMAARILPSPDPSGGNRSTKASNKLPGLTSEAMAADLKALRQQVEAVEKSRMDWRLADAMSQNMTLAMKKLKLSSMARFRRRCRSATSRSPSLATSSATHKRRFSGCAPSVMLSTQPRTPTATLLPPGPLLRRRRHAGTRQRLKRSRPQQMRPP